MPEDEFNGLLKSFGRINVPTEHADPASDGERSRTATQSLPSVQVDRRAADPLLSLKRFATATRERVLIVAESLGRRETMQQYFAEYGFKPSLVEDWAAFLGSDASPALAVGPLHRGFVWPEANLALVTEAELYADVARRPGKREGRRSNVDAMLRDLSEVRIGDPVVHEQHGIGRYLGLTTLDLGDGANEFLHLLYANDAQLYVPVSSLHLIGRYSGASPEAAPLHELGSGQWAKAKKAALRAHDTAAELPQPVRAARAARRDTPSSSTCTITKPSPPVSVSRRRPTRRPRSKAVIGDLVSGKPMDRLVCGDVGFGKDRGSAACRIRCGGGRQSRSQLLVPTTLLVEQHFQTFSDRFADLPVKLCGAVAVSLHRRG